MEGTLREMTLAVLSNNEVIIGQTRDINTKIGSSNQTVDNLEKIYDEIYKKIETAPQELTSYDCQFLVTAINITLAALKQQLNRIEISIELYEKLQSIYTDASEQPGALLKLLSEYDTMDLLDVRNYSEKSEIEE